MLPGQLYCNSNWIHTGRLDYALEAPPAHVAYNSKKHQTSFRFSWLHRPAKDDPAGTVECMSPASEQYTSPRGSLPLLAAAKAGWPAQQTLAALQAQENMAPELAWRSVLHLLQSQPQALHLHEYALQLGTRLNKLAELEQSYTALATAMPQLMLLQLGKRQHRVAKLQAMRQRWPELAASDALLARTFQQQGQNPEALQYWQRYLQRRPALDDINLFAPEIIQAQWQGRQFGDSAALLKRLQNASLLDQRTLPLYERLWRFLPPDSQLLPATLPQITLPPKPAQISALQSGRLPDPLLHSSLVQALYQLHRGDPHAALNHLQRTSADDLYLLDEAHYTLLLGYSVLQENEAALGLLLQRKGDARQRQAMLDWIKGSQAGQAAPPLPAPVLAAAADLRALAGGLPAAEKQALHKLALQLEPVPGPQHWYAPR